MSSADYVTGSAVRLEFRRVINKAIDAWVWGPVELLGPADLRELRAVLRKEFVGRRAGYRYAAWLAEVNLALGAPDPLRALRGKAPAKWIRRARLSAAVLEWLDGQGPARVDDGTPDQVEDLLEGFRKKS